jgi:hypothetical protein
VLAISSSGCFVRVWRKVRQGVADSPRGAGRPGVRRVLREFLRRFDLICLAGRFWLDLVGWTVRQVRPDHPPGEAGPSTRSG